MDTRQHKFIRHIIDIGKDMTLATMRPDGFPQATTVSYANDDLVLYVGIGIHSQKASNIRYCNKVSLTINASYVDWDDIQGLSIAAYARILEEPDAIRHASERMARRYPQVAKWTGEYPFESSDVILLEIRPVIVSMLDYRQGFGHTELVTL
ncbi:pyridoxamine 5'-phosphate oxidase family protein [Actimicrobium sp. CCI2.3]|uniref:pyridoxamine 5'-phosphate oxidase family protein n=1 Tax=Actimicrobium sp. CCI2.3 TaxID=3048616 RepID=UPI002AB4475C|nr:pyridoxamine 5'-phosphate oxidase family protein [Actimicrobium sp. CCI2.3]MDY7575517.1 pyridoxamine 5'-phosphate oxidase family protein [Actimicrobium sp. CCI2.3]MEB0023753.1 pyridoxamine 5'-phosphate oxidase family protein [Actimicrobium sp. CCI2.3]